MAVISTLRERIKSYENISDFRLLPKVPIVLVLNGRGFRKITSLLPKPFALSFSELICATMVKLFQEIEGVVFSYSFNDQIVLILRNDKSIDTAPWYDNCVQKIVSAASSIATLEFNKIAKENGIPLFGDPIFISQAFVVPNIIEAINVLISKQQEAFHSSLYNACFYELLKIHNIDVVQQTLIEKNAQAKADILLEQCGKDFSSYDLCFRRGIANYREERAILTEAGSTMKNKLIVNMELPVFAKEPDFLNRILKR